MDLERLRLTLGSAGTPRLRHSAAPAWPRAVPEEMLAMGTHRGQEIMKALGTRHQEVLFPLHKQVTRSASCEHYPSSNSLHELHNRNTALQDLRPCRSITKHPKKARGLSELCNFPNFPTYSPVLEIVAQPELA